MDGEEEGLGLGRSTSSETNLSPLPRFFQAVGTASTRENQEWALVPGAESNYFLFCLSLRLEN